MRCRPRAFIPVNQASPKGAGQDHPAFPDTLMDYLSNREIPFSNRDNIRQKLVRTLVEGKGYLKEDISLSGEIRFEMEGLMISSPVDITVGFGGRTLIVFKCASGSVVSRERQIIATARLLEDYVVPFAVVTNGVDLELLDPISEKIIGEGTASIPGRLELFAISKDFVLRPSNKRKLVYEQRVLYTYDAMSCNISCKNSPAPRII